MAQFKGDSRDAKRARQGARVQEEMKEAFERKIQQMRQETEVAVQNMELNQMFSYEDNTADKKFKDSIIGLQSHDEYKNKLDTYLEQTQNNNNNSNSNGNGNHHYHHHGANTMSAINSLTNNYHQDMDEEEYLGGINMGGGINMVASAAAAAAAASSGSSMAPGAAAMPGMAGMAGDGSNQEYTNSSTSQRLKMLEKQLLYKKNKGRKRKPSDLTLSFDFDEDIATATPTIVAPLTTPIIATTAMNTINNNSISKELDSTNANVVANVSSPSDNNNSSTTTTNTANTTPTTPSAATTSTNTNMTAIPIVTPDIAATAVSIPTSTPTTATATALANIDTITPPASKRRKLSKNPHVDTSFLPDPERDAADARLRMELEKEWSERQKQVKRERLEITYSYWDGSGHRRSIEIVKGMKVGEFLELCRKELSQHFSELRGISGEHLMYIKDDLIIPHSYAFYDLILAGGRGKSGNYMFKNESYDKGDYRIERDGGHPGKIITRAWYDRNKHIFPASRWEVYDPTTQDENR